MLFSSSFHRHYPKQSTMRELVRLNFTPNSTSLVTERLIFLSFYRLINPNFCPLNGSRLSHCSCHRDHPDEGLTVFQKVRFDVRNMRVLGQ